MRLGFRWQPPNKSSWLRNLPWRFIILIIIFLVVYAFIHFLNQPSTGDIKAVTTPTPQTAKAATKQSGRYSGKYLSFDIPAGFSQMAKQPSSFLESVQFLGTGVSDSLIAISLIRESLDNDAGYHLRLGNTDIYKEVTSRADQKTFTSKAHGSERTTYIVHGGLVLAVSATSSSGQDVASAQQQIIDSLRWR